MAQRPSVSAAGGLISPWRNSPIPAIIRSEAIRLRYSMPLISEPDRPVTRQPVGSSLSQPINIGPCLWSKPFQRQMKRPAMNPRGPSLGSYQCVLHSRMRLLLSSRSSGDRISNAKPNGWNVMLQAFSSSPSSAIRFCHSFGALTWTFWPSLSTATVTGKS